MTIMTTAPQLIFKERNQIILYCYLVDNSWHIALDTNILKLNLSGQHLYTCKDVFAMEQRPLGSLNVSHMQLHKSCYVTVNGHCVNFHDYYCVILRLHRVTLFTKRVRRVYIMFQFKKVLHKIVSNAVKQLLDNLCVTYF